MRPVRVAARRRRFEKCFMVLKLSQIGRSLDRVQDLPTAKTLLGIPGRTDTAIPRFFLSSPRLEAAPQSHTNSTTNVNPDTSADPRTNACVASLLNRRCQRRGTGCRFDHRAGHGESDAATHLDPRSQVWNPRRLGPERFRLSRQIRHPQKWSVCPNGNKNFLL